MLKELEHYKESNWIDNMPGGNDHFVWRFPICSYGRRAGG